MLNLFRRRPEKKKEINWVDIRKNPELIPDWFIMFHFRVLPTDPKFKAMSERQKLYLFKMYLESPTPDQYKAMWDEKHPKGLYTAPDKGAIDLMEKWHGKEAAKEFVKLGG